MLKATHSHCFTFANLGRDLSKNFRETFGDRCSGTGWILFLMSEQWRQRNQGIAYCIYKVIKFYICYSINFLNMIIFKNAGVSVVEN